MFLVTRLDKGRAGICTGLGDVGHGCILVTLRRPQALCMFTDDSPAASPPHPSCMHSLGCNSSQGRVRRVAQTGSQLWSQENSLVRAEGLAQAEMTTRSLAGTSGRSFIGS